ncbi:hypothetical protein [Massilia puerhi]|uniref:hypothetical protein n=1 Tax=Massilia puerhi TaxID=2681550 RepID=UPI0013573C7D|nr:hypothetical protein [Massilia puerhi]
MESLLWAIDLALVAYFCIWAIREDSNSKHDDMPGGKQVTPEAGREQTRKRDHA